MCEERGGCSKKGVGTGLVGLGMGVDRNTQIATRKPHATGTKSMGGNSGEELKAIQVVPKSTFGILDWDEARPCLILCTVVLCSKY